MDAISRTNDSTNEKEYDTRSLLDIPLVTNTGRKQSSQAGGTEPIDAIHDNVHVPQHPNNMLGASFGSKKLASGPRGLQA